MNYPINKDNIVWKKRTSKFSKYAGNTFVALILIVGVIYLISGKNIDFTKVWNAFFTKQEVAENILEKTFMMEKKVFGYSEQGKEIGGYELGNGANIIFMMASIHGNEMGTVDLLNKLIDGIKADPKLVPESKKLIIIPIVNPDGYYDRTDNLNANKVNLNLNFETTNWTKYGSEGNFAGNEPFSERESQAIRDVVKQYKPNIMISFHSSGALISPEAGESSEKIARWFSQKTGYDYFGGWDYPGTATRWFAETTNNPAITIEISKDLQSDWDRNNASLLEFIASDSLTIL
ncbi:MAG: hypothetical protein US74_C0021G0012 [Parcubacteria group bacterium GW2011_GWA2_38_13]|nr:MAG: hypothetical protein US74_C0021G0012 [Parcubacteria group bacterium GW2011_GWA2_38_13]